MAGAAGRLPPWKTVYGLHAQWKADGVLADITDLLRARVRRAAGRDPEPSLLQVQYDGTPDVKFSMVVTAQDRQLRLHKES